MEKGNLIYITILIKTGRSVLKNIPNYITTMVGKGFINLVKK